MSEAAEREGEVDSVEEVALEERPIWEALLEIDAAVPEGEWAKVPNDLARNVDHYLYGARKREG